MDIFERVTQNVSIFEYVASETGSKAKKVGQYEYRINPCPFCGHNDCFTIYVKTNSFKCWSCDQAGDVIHFERYNQGLPGNFEAARSIAEKMGISLDGLSSAKKPKRKAVEHPEGEPEEVPDIEPAKARALRGIVAEFYHGELFSNKKALEYQTGKRGHSLEVLKKFKVGYAGRKSLISHVKNLKEYSVEDLVNVGLVKELRKGFVPIIPQGHYAYPHCVNGAVLFFSIKDPSGKLKFQIKKKYAGEGWLCFNQDALDRDGAVIVEGENDLLSLLDKAKSVNVACVVGNFNSPSILDYLKTNSKGKTFNLCFDRDDAGRKYVKRYSSAILAGGGQVKVIEIPEPHNDIDDFLKASKDPQGEFKRLVEDAKVIDKPKVRKKRSRRNKSEGDKFSSQDLCGDSGSNRYEFKSFEVIGELEDGKIVIQSKDNGKIYTVNINKELTLEKAIQFGGEEVRRRVVRNVERAKEPGKIHFYDLRQDIILKARKKQRGKLRWVGQGISLLDDGRLLVVNGDAVYTWNGTAFESCTSATIENKFIARNTSRKWISFRLLEKAVLSMTTERGKEIVVKAIQLVQQWGFGGAYDHALVAGFILSQMIQAVWLWRPHLWLTGPQGSGKTLLVNLCEEIAGELSRRFEGSSITEAGFRQSIKHDFCLAYIDEFERNSSSAREQIISYLRTAGRGGPIVKGTPGQEAIEYMLKHMVLVASIETGLVRAAEKTRFLTVELKKDPERDPHIPTVEEMERLRVEFFAVALWSAFRAKKLVNQLGRIQGYGPRLIEAFAVPLSMLSVLDPEPLESLKKNVMGVLENLKERGDGNIPEDEVRLLDDILTSKIRVAVTDDSGHTVYVDRSIQWLLQSSSELHKNDLKTHGIKKCDDGVFFDCKVVSRELLRNTLWKEMQIASILGRLPGTEESQRRINGRRPHGILCRQMPGLFNKQKPGEKAKDGSEDLFFDD
jgi:Toprim-like/CHC2 zinc finger